MWLPLHQAILTGIELFHFGMVSWLVDGLYRFNAILARVEYRQAAEFDVGDAPDDGRMLIEP